MSTEHTNTEVVIIGAGPIGLETAAAFTRVGVDCLHIDAGQIGQTFFKWPRSTLFYSSPEWIAIAGIPIHSPDQFCITGERYLSYLRMVAETLELNVRTYEKVTDISGEKGNFIVETDFVYCATGFRQDPALFAAAGVELRDSGGNPTLSPQTMETNVPGVFVVGTAAGGSQVDFDEFITTGHVHVKLDHESPHRPHRRGHRESPEPRLPP